MREDYTKPDQAKIEKYYAQRKARTKPKGVSVHGHDCTCKACYEEWAWSTGFETMNPEGRERMRRRNQAIQVSVKQVSNER